MKTVKLLFDTNVIIGLEDAKQVSESFADLVRKCGEKGIHQFVHEASEADIKRDRNVERRAITLSKIRKFERLTGVTVPDRAKLSADFGSIVKNNDLIDSILLHALKANIVDFLVSQDGGLHKRAARVGLEDRVFTVDEALSWLNQTYEPKKVQLPYIQEVKAYSIDRTDDIFEGLRDDYAGFDTWFDKCRAEHRDCWVAIIAGELAGLIIRKDETQAEADAPHKGKKILKICTFKVKPKYWGEKFGEQLLKQVLWWAQRNRYDVTYLTAFPTQTFLINMLRGYGFEETGKRDNGEVVLEKVLSRGLLKIGKTDSPLNFHRHHYPRFVDGAEIRKFVVPIWGDYHAKLFPELGELSPTGTTSARIPGNTIRKVYLCRAPTTALRPGDILFFYLCSTPGAPSSQCITTVGIVEDVRETEDLDELLRWTAKRSVFSADELSALIERKATPLKVIDFLLAGHLDPAIHLDQLMKKGILLGAPQSITNLLKNRYDHLKPLVNLGF